MQEGVAFGFLILGHRKATLPSQRGAVVAPKQPRTWSGTISEGEGRRFPLEDMAQSGYTS
jgi:hypothetical protein